MVTTAMLTFSAQAVYAESKGGVLKFATPSAGLVLTQPRHALVMPTC